VISMIQRAWYGWTDLFDGLPYGDPYLAFATLFVIIVVAAKMVAGSSEESRY